MQIKYEMIIYWSEVDQAFIVQVPELPGCAADGETYQQAVQNAEVVIQEWIETAIELGRSIPEPKGETLPSQSSIREETTMEGVQFVVNEAGEKTAVLLDLEALGDLWEDFYDILIARSRAEEATVSWDALETELDLEVGNHDTV